MVYPACTLKRTEREGGVRGGECNPPRRINREITYNWGLKSKPTRSAIGSMVRGTDNEMAFLTSKMALEALTDSDVGSRFLGF